jgi:hypothetical protein
MSAARMTGRHFRDEQNQKAQTSGFDRGHEFP